MMMMMTMTVKVNVEVVQRPVIFPSVTICNKNHLDTLVVDKLDMFVGVDDSSSTTTTADTRKFLQRYNEFSDKLTALLKHADNLSLKQYSNEMSEVPIPRLSL